VNDVLQVAACHVREGSRLGIAGNSSCSEVVKRAPFQ
jgi:hypothetical protein